MKKYNKYIFGILIVLGMTSCAKYLDVNQTPNSPLDVPPSLLLPSGQVGMAFASNNEVHRVTSTWVQHLAGAANAPGGYDVYTIDASSTNNAWNGEFFQGSLSIFKRLVEVSEKGGNPAYAGVAKIQLAYTFAVATDLWGDIPYSEALLGSEKGITQPRFDKQEDIYKGNASLGIKSLFDLVREGRADLLKASPLTPGATDDLIYRGNLALWRKAANTLLVKLALQISDRDAALAKQVMDEAIADAGGLITSNAENFNVPFFAVVGSQNPIYQFTIFTATFNNDLVASLRFVNRLQALADPRLPLYFTQPTTPGVYVAKDNGAAGAFTTVRSRYAAYVVGTGGETPVRLMTNAQRCFMLAEATLRFGVNYQGRTADQLFKDGITASMTDAGVASGTITAYIANPANAAIVTLTGTPSAQLQQIITQKYIACFGNPYEAFNDWRRTGFPVLAVAQNAAGVDGTIPVRLPYTTNEIERNPNLPRPIPVTNQRVWWDVN